jgi:hypothetical protein
LRLILSGSDGTELSGAEFDRVNFQSRKLLSAFIHLRLGSQKDDVFDSLWVCSVVAKECLNFADFVVWLVGLRVLIYMQIQPRPVLLQLGEVEPNLPSASEITDF